jgi:superfamily II DNA or RNA helicase
MPLSWHQCQGALRNDDFTQMSRGFSTRQRTIAFLSTDGLCALCGVELDPDNFHVDHIIPWSNKGETTQANAQPLCPACNLKKGNNMLLSYQQEAQQIFRDMKTSTEMRLIIFDVVCGGGKSIIPVIGAHELIPSRVDRICWVSPRHNLRIQGEDNFLDQNIRNILGHNLEIRSSVNEADPVRDKIGYTTTYQALTTASYSPNWDNPHYKTFQKYRMMLILDESQHCVKGGHYHNALLPYYEMAAVRVIMSGGLSRHDKKPIAFLDYLPPDVKGRQYIDLSETRQRRVVRYSLQESTREKQSIEIKFELRDAEAAWEITDDSGEILEGGAIESFDGANKNDTSRGLMTALRTDFAEKLLTEGANFWQHRKQANQRSKLLIVCSSIEQANKITRLLRTKLGIAAEVAHSDDDASAIMILRFRGKHFPEVDVLVTVAMAYEGLNCPPADVLICLTHIRSREWIEQMIHRVSRRDRDGLPWERQFATIFAPRDQFFIAIMKDIQNHQLAYLPEPEDPVGGEPGEPKKHLRALDSSMGDASNHTFDSTPIDGDKYRQLKNALDKSGLYGYMSIDQAQQFAKAMQDFKEDGEVKTKAETKPASVREKDLRVQIENLKRTGYNKDNPESVIVIRERGKAIWRMFSKRVEDLTEPQLEAVWKDRDRWMKVYPSTTSQK